MKFERLKPGDRLGRYMRVCKGYVEHVPDQSHRNLDLVGHAAYAILVLGVYLIGQKQIAGWYCYVVGDVVWCWLGWNLRLTSVWVWQLVFLVLALQGLWSWL